MAVHGFALCCHPLDAAAGWTEGGLTMRLIDADALDKTLDDVCVGIATAVPPLMQKSGAAR